jgi:branched-chain amino acid transport system permease protein
MAPDPRSASSPTLAGIPVRLWRTVAIVVLLGGAGLLPFAVSEFRLFQFTQVLIYAIALTGLNILTGYNGQISLGHGAFYAVGAYTAAIMLERWHVAYGWTIPAAGLVCLALGFLFGRPALRLDGLYLALATFALALATPQILKYFEHWTGGSQGLVLTKPTPPFGLPLGEDQWLYFIALALAVVALAVARNLVRGRPGRAMLAIRDNPLAAQSMGVNTALYKSLAFGVSAAYTGVAGALSALAVAFVAPDSFTVFLSITLLTGVVIGGLATIEGAVFGALFIQFVPNLAQDISQAAPWAIFGVFLILFMYLMPHGIAGALHQAYARLTAPRDAALTDVVAGARSEPDATRGVASTGPAAATGTVGRAGGPFHQRPRAEGLTP